MVNGQRLKHYISGDSYNEDVDFIKVVTSEDFIKSQIQATAEADLEQVTVSLRKCSYFTFQPNYSLFLHNIENFESKKGRKRCPRARHHPWARAPP